MLSARHLAWCLHSDHWLPQMRHFARKEDHREKTFGRLIKQWLMGMLPKDIQLQHQTRGESVVDVQLRVEVGEPAPCWMVPVRCHVLVLQFQLGHLRAGMATYMWNMCPGCRLQR